MTSIEQTELKGITAKVMAVILLSTISMVGSVATTYFNLKDDIHDVRSAQILNERVNDLRLKTLEQRVEVLQHQVDALKDK